MSRQRSKRWRRAGRAPPGSAPGLLIADPSAPKPHAHVIAYGPDRIHDQPLGDLAELARLRAEYPVLWINVDGLGDVDLVERLGRQFNLHRLALEDVLNTQQRPKVEQYPDNLFIVARMAVCDPQLETEQLAMFLGRGFVITFQQGLPGDSFALVRERIRKSGGRLRQLGADHLAYALLDAVIDGYFPVLETIGERLEHIEDEVLSSPARATVQRIHETKRELLTLRRAMWPLREAMNSLIRDEHDLIAAETRVYLRDCYDHCVRILDFVETYRELGSDLMDLYLSSASNRMNEIMKVLTIMSTIFIPLTFISSIYGMNFHLEKSPWNMPELDWYWGYPFVLALMAAVAAGLLVFFRRRGWLGQPALTAHRADSESCAVAPQAGRDRAAAPVDGSDAARSGGRT